MLAVLLAGCADAKWFDASLDSRTEPTYWFWGGINGVKYRARSDMDRLLQQMKDAQQRHNLDAVADAMQGLGEQYSETARLLDHLNADDVDEEAVAFRDRYAAFHRDVGALYNHLATATRDRDAPRIQELNAELRTFHAQAPQLSSEKDSLQATLAQRYDRDFNIVDRH